MRVLMNLALVAAMSAGAAQAQAGQPENMSCIVDAPQGNLQVLRDCENAYVPEKPPIEEVYLTPSEIPMIGPHDGGTKSDHTGNHDRPDHDGNSGGGAGGPNGAN